MAMSAHLLHLKRPGLVSLHSPTPPTQCASRARISLAPISPPHFKGHSRLRHGFETFGGAFTRRAPLCPPVVAAASDEASEPAEEARDPTESTSFPAEFRDLIVDRGDPPNLFLYAAGFFVVVLMRDVIVHEIAIWGINFARVALYIAEGITIGFGKLTNATATPIAFLMALASWVIMAIDDTYTFIIDSAPVRPLLIALLLSLAVLSIGDAASPRPRGSRSRLVSLAATLSLAGALELVPLEAVVPSLLLITLFAKFVQKADAVTVLMPATVALVTISEPVLQAAALGVFVAVSVWRAGKERQLEGEMEASGVKREVEASGEKREIEAAAGKRPSVMFLAITGAICVSLSARFLYLRTVKWLLLRSL